MKKNILKPASWVIANKARSLVGLKPVLNAQTRESVMANNDQKQR